MRELTELLSTSGVETFVWDPYVDPLEFPDWVTSVESPVAETGFDLVVQLQLMRHAFLSTGRIFIRYAITMLCLTAEEH